MRMGRKLLFAAVLIISLFTLCGCWDYNGLNDLTIVAGLAIDKTEDGELQLTLETLDTSKEEGTKPKLLIVKGRSLKDAFSSAHMQFNSTLYLGNTELVIIQQKIAEEDGLTNILDSFLHNADIRDNLTILIASEDKAGDLLMQNEDSNDIISFKINRVIAASKRVATLQQAKALELDQLYNSTKSLKGSACIPLIKFADKQSREHIVDGAAVFVWDKMVGSFSVNDAPFFRMATVKIAGGSLSADLGSDRFVTFIIDKSVPKQSFTHKGDDFKFIIDIDMDVSLVELFNIQGEIDKTLALELSSGIKLYLENELTRVAKFYQSKKAGDPYLFAGTIMNSDYELWTNISARWINICADAEIEINCNVEIMDSGILKKY